MATESFQFNFKVGDPGPNDDDTSSHDDDIEESEGHDDFGEPIDSAFWPSYDARTLMPAEELQASRRDATPPEMEEVEVAPGLVFLKGRVTGAEAAELLKNTKVSESDLVPNVYEGGFKLWEGAIDLCHYMLDKYKINPDDLINNPSYESPLAGKRVLELGCGHGLPGILALLAGADVHFQDFNKEVLTRLTIPNVLANMARVPPGKARGCARFFSGDWHYIGELLTGKGYGGHYDLILSSESIYNVASQRRLIECVKQVLQPPLGLVLVAAKAHYFGVGGGIKAFKQAVKIDGIFEVTHVYKTTKDVSSAMRPIQRASTSGTPAEAADSLAAATDSLSKLSSDEGLDKTTPKDQQSVPGEKQDGKGAVAGAGQDTEDAGGNVREVLQLAFPIAILPYFL